MRSAAPCLLLLFLTLAAAEPQMRGSGEAPCAAPEAQDAPCTSGRGILFDFDIISERSSYEANVSDPDKPSAALVVTVVNNGTSPGSMRLSASINLGGRVELSPARTGVMLPKESVGVAVTVYLPDTTPSALVATLRIDGQCEQSPAVTDYLQLSISVRQWHGVRLENVTLSSGSPVEGELLQLSAHVRNTGNGGSYFAASARIDGCPVTPAVGGERLEANSTVHLEAGEFMILSLRWVAAYGHHNFVIEAWDAGPAGEGNGSAVLARDSRVVQVFVGWNYRDWIPYILAAALACALAGAICYRHRGRVRAFFAARRLRRLEAGPLRGSAGASRLPGLAGPGGQRGRRGQRASTIPGRPPPDRGRGG
ncbi:MAG: COG1470 family protein [Thermoplasmatota archaeon]